MNIKRTLWVMACCTNFCFISNATASKTITVYDSSQLCGGHHKNAKYRVQLAAFHTQHSAEQYRNKIAKMTAVPVHVVRSKRAKNTYQVIAEPITSVSDSNELCALLSNNTMPHLKTAARVSTQPIQTSVLMHPSEPEVIKPHPWKDMATNTGFNAGPYLGVSLGLQQNMTATPTAYSGLEGTLSGGIGHLWNQRYYLAGEVFGGTSANLKNYPAATTGNSVRSTWSYGIDVLPGFMINHDVLLYGRAGVLRTRFSDINAEKNAWQVGLGGQTTIYKTLDLRAEYIYSLYQSIGAIGRPQVNQFNVGLVKKFG